MESRGVLLNRCLASIATATTDPCRTGNPLSLVRSATFDLVAAVCRGLDATVHRGVGGAGHEAGGIARVKGDHGRNLRGLAGDGGCDFGRAVQDIFVLCRSIAPSLLRGAGQIYAHTRHKGRMRKFVPFAGRAEGSLLLARTFSLTHDILRALVGPEPEVDGLAQFALARPLREFDLGNQRGPDPGRGGLVFHFGRKG